ncbi:MAG: DNA gyrase subunit A, partial [Rhodobiaceae bacterium]|nr:DNA gyrase subunit A [Rhodobiaceae bacterium]
TNIPPHNLREVVAAATRLIDAPETEIEELMQIIPGPDFPTGGLILGQSGIRSAYTTGRGSILMRGRVQVEEIRKEREALIISEIPYQVNKSVMIERIAELVRDKKIENIADIRDESDRHGMRVVIELKRDAVPDVVLNQLYRFSALQGTFGANMVALNNGRPETMNLKDMLQAFIRFREKVVSRRTKFLLGKARDRAHVLVGLAIAVANIDEVIRMIRTAPDPASARAALMERNWPAGDVSSLITLIDDPRHTINEDGTYKLSEEQARAILDLRLQRLTALGRDEIGDELNKLGEQIKDYLDILGSRARIMSIVKQEMAEVAEEFGTDRRTEIVEHFGDIDDEDLIQREEMVVTVTHGGYIKRVPLDTYRAQHRGGKGRTGMAMREDDFVAKIFAASTHTSILFFSSRGMVYKMKVWRLPQAAPQARGKALVNILPLAEGETITTIMPLPEDEAASENYDVMFATCRGTVRRNRLSDFVQVNRNGKIAMKLDEDGDSIISVQICNDQEDVLLTTLAGQCIRFPVGDVRVFAGRNSVGVRGINLGKEDEVISMSILRHFEANSEERGEYLKRSRMMRGDSEDTAGDDAEPAGGDLSADRYVAMSAAEQFVLTLSENGYGKRTSSHEYRTTGRGGKGIVAMTVNDRNGPLIASFPVEDHDQVMLVTNSGQLIRCPVDNIRIAGRSTQGVTIFNVADGDRVVSVERIGEVNGDDDGDEGGQPDMDGPAAAGPAGEGESED